MALEVRRKIDVEAVITGVTVTIPEYVTAIIDNIQSGVVDVKSFPNQDKLLNLIKADTDHVIISTGYTGAYIQARYQVTTQLIASGTTLASATETLSSAVDIDKFERKTVLGFTNFDGTLKIYLAPVSGRFLPYAYYSASISSGTTFSASFSENAAQVKVGITPSATGTCGVWLITQA